jgi:hypothetical protein
MSIGVCFECDTAGPVHHHHVVPQSRGGTKTVPLCEACHGKAHHRDRAMSTSRLTKDALTRRKRQGKRVGGTPYGFVMHGDYLAKHPEEWPVVERILGMRRRRKTWAAIGSALQAGGAPAKKGGTWWPMTVKRIHDRAVRALRRCEQLAIPGTGVEA